MSGQPDKIPNPPQKQQHKEKEKKPKPQKDKRQQNQPKDKASESKKPVNEQKPKQQQQQQKPIDKKPKQQQQQGQGKKVQQQQKQAKASGGAPKKPEHEKKEDIFQAVLLADNFSCSIFGPEVPKEASQEGLLQLLNRRMIDYSLESLTSSGVQEIFLYCSTQSEEFRKYFLNSKWATLPGTSIKVVVGEDAMSLGDALRDLDAKGVLRSDFILMTAGVVCNLNLRELLNIHRENVKNDKGAVMTLVHRKLLPGHRSRSKLSNAVIVINSSSGKILAYDSRISGKRLNLPIENLSMEMDIYMDSVDTGITVCSTSVPPLFSDNFDFTTIQDAIKEIMINEEILGNSIYLHRLNRGYANRVIDYETFEGISYDIMERWSYPCVPDIRFGSDSDNSNYSMHPNFVYKANNVKIRGANLITTIVGSTSEIGAGSEVQHTSIGKNCRVGENVRLLNCQIGDNVTIPDECSLSKCIVASGNVLKERVSWEHVLLVKSETYSISCPVDVGEGEDDISDDAESLDGSDSSGPDTEFHEDKDFQMFSNEVIESLLRGYKENVATENLVLEINSSKFAYNMSFKEVTTSICKGTLLVAPKIHVDFYEKPSKVQWEKTRDVLVKLKSLFANYVKTDEAQIDLLESLEEYANDTPMFRPMLMQTLHLLYDEDILSEDNILGWHKDTSLYEAGTELRILVKKFIEWLEAADSESESEED